MLSIALAHNWLELTNLIMDTIQCFVQAVPISEERAVAELLQLGGLKPENARSIVAKSELGREGIQGLFKVSDAERKELVGAKDIGEQQYDHIVKVAGEWPRIEFVDAFFKGERHLR